MKAALRTVRALGVAAALAGAAGEDAPIASFDHFSYVGNEVAARPTGADGYRNPILPGFYPDPSVTRAGDDYYLVTSTFGYFPGIPVFKSRNLVDWAQIGNVIDRPGMLDFGRLGMSRAVFAPTIEYHQGRFYVLNTCVDCGGNFVVTARDPRGPWSDPIWMPKVEGIDPSIFFDDDGRVYVLNNDAPDGPPRYPGHRVIRIREVEARTFQPRGPDRIIAEGARPETRPIWIEGPHLFKKDGQYYLSAAEGGTAEGHSQVVFRADDVLGPYRAFPGNPILTQRDLPPDRPNPVIATGHADMIEAADGGWWAVFLGVRPNPSGDFTTGRETFLLPVSWRNGWPVILERGKPVPLNVAVRPAAVAAAGGETPVADSITGMETFDRQLGPEWLHLRNPRTGWSHVADGRLHLTAHGGGLGDFARPSFVARRLQHRHATIETRVRFAPLDAGDEAGLAAFQNDEFYFALGVTRDPNGDRMVRLRRRAGRSDPADGVVVGRIALPGRDRVALRITARGDRWDFAASADGKNWRTVAADQDATILGTRRAGGFIGTTVGPYAGRDVKPGR